MHDGQPLALGARAFDVLLALVERRERLVTKDELLELAWPGVVVEENNLQVQISALRKLLGPQSIATIPGRGYRFTFELDEPMAPPTTVPARATRRQWLVTSLAAVVAVALVAALALWWRKEPTVTSVDAKSIAVLPFANMSEEESNRYFADGVHEDLLTHLSFLSELKVISRTSVVEYRDTKKNLRQIGTELGAGSIVEGSVRREGNRVRVTVQLIDAQSDKHIWGNTYDRELKDILAIQSELATEIARALKVSLTHGEQTYFARPPTDNFEAYELFLRHKEIVIREGSSFADVGMRERVDLLSRAVEVDPKFALAWAYLAADHALIHYLSLDPTDARLRKAQDALDRALALAPDDLEVRAAAGTVYLYGYRDLARTAQHVEQLLRAAPNQVLALNQLAAVRRRQGRWLESIALRERTLAVDPRNLDALAGLRDNYSLFRQFDRALAFQRRILELQPDSIDAHCVFYEIEYFKTGSFAGYDAWRPTLPAGSEYRSQRLWFMDFVRASARRDFESLLRLLDSEPPNFSRFLPPAFLRALVLWAKGDKAQAVAMAHKDVGRASAEQRAAPHDFIALMIVVFDRAILGERKEALEQFRHWAETEPQVKRDAVLADVIVDVQGRLYGLVGERGQLLQVLRHKTRRYGIWPVHDWSNSLYYARLWDDPEFKALIADPANNAPLPIVDEDPATVVAKGLYRG